jgi:succinyl-CoA synthetase alpha subunit
MGHAGAIISGGKGTAAEKMTAMKKAGIKVVESPAEIGITMKKALDEKKTKANESMKKSLKTSKIKKAATKVKKALKPVKKTSK